MLRLNALATRLFFIRGAALALLLALATQAPAAAQQRFDVAQQSNGATVSTTGGGICLLCGVENAPLIIDASTSNAARATVAAGVAGSVGVAVTFGEPRMGGGYAGFVFSAVSDVADVRLLDAIVVRTLDAQGDVVESSAGAGLLDLNVLGGLESGRRIAAIETSQPYASVEVRFGSLVGLLSEYDVNYAFAAAGVSRGDLIVTEAFPAPDDVPDARGEYLEVYNDTDASIDLDGLRFGNSAGTSFTVEADGATASGGTEVASNETYVLCRQRSVTHGGVPCDYEYPRAFALDETGDEVVLSNRFGNSVFETRFSDGAAFGEGVSYVLANLSDGQDGTATGPGGGAEYEAAPRRINDQDENGDGFYDMGTPGTIVEGAIPVEFAGAPRVTQRGDALDVRWKTLTEENNLGFFVQHRQRGTTEAAGWATANPEAMVEGAGSSATEQVYAYRFAAPSPGRYQFRIQQVDRDGDRATSPATQAVEVRSGAAFALRNEGPNPFSEATTLRYDAPGEAEARAALYNSLGQRVRTLKARGGRIVVKAGTLASGLYFVRLTSGGRSTVQAVTIAR